MRLFILIFVLSFWGALMPGCQAKEKPAPFSFEELRTKTGPPLGEPQFLKASDGINLAYYTKIPEGKTVAALIFLHGGGAYSGAGYQYLAEGLAANYRVAVYLLDLRGHGNSGGPRGDSPSADQVWKDLSLYIHSVKGKHPGIPLYLAGHSSGAGLALNYLAWEKTLKVNGLFFISPQFGYKSGTARENMKNSFTTVRTWVFLLSALSGGRLFGNTPAVYLNYPDAIFASQPLFLKTITRNMAVAITPHDPQEQFRKINKPFGLFIGGRDELFLPERVIQYFDLANNEIRPKSICRVLENENHLSILLRADEWIGKTITGWNSAGRPQ